METGNPKNYCLIKGNKRMNINNFNKKDWQWLYTHRCKEHNRRYTEHPACFKKDYENIDKPSALRERIGFLDIETSGLSANFSIMLTWSIKIGDKIHYDMLRKEDFNTDNLFKVDKRIVKSIIEEINGLDRIVTHYGRKFDLPYIRTRALLCDLEFPNFGSISNDDTYYLCKNKLRLTSNRLETAMQLLYGYSNKTHLDGNIWIPASMGNEKALAQILKHNKTDVQELELIWLKLRDFVGKRNTSI